MLFLKILANFIENQLGCENFSILSGLEPKNFVRAKFLKIEKNHPS